MWLIIGILLGLAAMALVFWMRNKHIALRWYEWLLAVLGLALLFFALQNSVAAAREFEPTAPSMFLLVLGVPALVFLILAVGLPWLRLKKVPVRLFAVRKPATAKAPVFKANQGDLGA
jgi:hypothetical protein